MRVLERAAAAEEKRKLMALNAIKKEWKGLFAEARGVIQQRKKLDKERRVVRVIRRRLLGRGTVMFTSRYIYIDSALGSRC